MAAKIICFDLDGTLVDSGQAHAHSFNLAFKKNNLEQQATKKIINALGTITSVLIKKFFPNISDRKLEQVIKDHHAFLAKESAENIKPIADVVYALTELKEKYKLAVISNAQRETVSILLKKAGIDVKLFDLILAEEDQPGTKPFPYALEKVEKELNAKIEYYVGDTIYDIRAGKGAGVKTVAVLTGIHNIKQLGEEEPTLIVKDVSILLDILFERL